MTASTLPSPADHTLGRRLMALSRRRHAALRWTALTTRAWVLAGLLLAVILFDAAWPMEDGARCAVAVALLAGIVFAAVQVLIRRSDRGRAVWREARQLEQRLGLTNNPLVNALWLASAAKENPTQLPGVLAERAVAHGQESLHDAQAQRSIDRRPLRRQVIVLGAVALAWLAAGVFDLRLPAGGLARLLDPFGDHPPYSLAVVHVQSDPAQPPRGRDVRVTADFTASPPRAAELVEVDSRGRALQRWPMSPQAATPRVAVFHFTLRALREPVTVQVAWASGWSKRLTITPAPEAVAAAAPRPEGKTPNTAATTSTGTGDEGSQADATMRSAMADASALAEEARRLRALAERLMASLAQDSNAIPADLSTADLNQLQAVLESLQQQGSRSSSLSQALRTWLAAHPGQPDPGARALLEQLAKDLAALESPGLRSSAPGVGSGAIDPARASPWLNRLSRSADRDSHTLDQAAAALAQALGGRSNRGGGDSTTVIFTPAPGAGAGIDTVNPGHTLNTAQAVIEQAPAVYRTLVSKYYDCLAHDAPPAAPSPGGRGPG